jgi:tRNA pseudouridine55 synthase
VSRRSRGRNDELLQGILLVDKPAGMTSHEVCQVARSRMRLGKVGHGGTLDPFATGLLPLLLNGATRLMTWLQAKDKVYEATVRFGTSTDTMDPTGEVMAEGDPSGIDAPRIEAALPAFRGPIVQTIPRYSAARVEGKRLYEYARSGEEVELPTKQVEIHAYDLLSVEPGDGYVDAFVRVHCSAGTYIRALADDLGTALGCPAHLVTLRRTRTGTLDMAGGIELSAISERSALWRTEREARQEAAGVPERFDPAANSEAWRAFLGEALRPVGEMLGMPVLRAPAPAASALRDGRPLRKGHLAHLVPPLTAFARDDRFLVETPDGSRAIAVVRAACSSETLVRLADEAVILEPERVLR